MNRQAITDIAMTMAALYADPKLPIKIYPMTQKMGIAVKLFEQKDENDGLAIKVRGKMYILVSKDTCHIRQRFTSAHELGHVVQGHVGEWVTPDGFYIRENRAGDIERQANAFAAELLMPTCVLIALQVDTVDRIMQICDVGYSAARRRLKEIRKRVKSGNPFTLAEQSVVDRFADYIRQQTTKAR